MLHLCGPCVRHMPNNTEKEEQQRGRMYGARTFQIV